MTALEINQKMILAQQKISVYQEYINRAMIRPLVLLCMLHARQDDAAMTIKWFLYGKPPAYWNGE